MPNIDRIAQPPNKHERFRVENPAESIVRDGDAPEDRECNEYVDHIRKTVDRIAIVPGVESECDCAQQGKQEEV